MIIKLLLGSILELITQHTIIGATNFLDMRSHALQVEGLDHFRSLWCSLLILRHQTGQFGLKAFQIISHLVPLSLFLSLSLVSVVSCGLLKQLVSRSRNNSHSHPNDCALTWALPSSYSITWWAWVGLRATPMRNRAGKQENCMQCAASANFQIRKFNYCCDFTLPFPVCSHPTQSCRLRYNTQ